MSELLLETRDDVMQDRRTIVFWQYAVTEKAPILDPELFECIWLDDPASMLLIERLDKTRPCIFFVSLQARRVLEKTGFHPIISDTPFMFCPSYILASIPEYMLSPDMSFLPLGRVAKMPETLPEEFFIRPDSGAKTFPGQVLRRDDIPQFIATYKSISPYDSVAIAQPRTIVSEVRVFLDTASGTIITSSSYKHADQNQNTPDYEVNDELKNLVFKVGQSLFNAGIAEIVVADFALTLDDGPKLIELNSVSTSGIYNASIKDIVEAIMIYL